MDKRKRFFFTFSCIIVVFMMSKLCAFAEETYTFEDKICDVYVSKTTNIRDKPCLEGKKVGTLGANESILTTGRCVETGWYKVIREGQICYMSDLYVMDFVVKISAGIITPNSDCDCHILPYEDAEVCGQLEEGTEYTYSS